MSTEEFDGRKPVEGTHRTIVGFDSMILDIVRWRKILSDFKDYITAVNWQAVEMIRQKMFEKLHKSKPKKEKLA